MSVDLHPEQSLGSLEREKMSKIFGLLFVSSPSGEEKFWFAGTQQEADASCRGFLRHGAREAIVVSLSGETIFRLAKPEPLTAAEKAARETARRARQLERAAACQAAKGQSGGGSLRFGGGISKKASNRKAR